MAAAVPERRLSALGRSLSNSGSSSDGSWRAGSEAAEAFAAASRAQADAYRLAPSAAAPADGGAGPRNAKSLEEDRPLAASPPLPALRRQQSVPCFPLSPMAQLRVSRGLDRCQHGSSAALSAMSLLQSAAGAGAESPLNGPHALSADFPDVMPRGRRCVARAAGSPRGARPLDL